MKQHTYLEYQFPSGWTGYLVKCDTEGCPFAAEVIVGYNMWCKQCADKPIQNYTKLDSPRVEKEHV